MHTKIANFLTYYQQGKVSQARGEIFPHIESTYDDIEDEDPLNDLFINYIDSLFFASPRSAFICNRLLHEQIIREGYSHYCPQFIQQVSLEDTWLSYRYGHSPLPENTLKKFKPYITFIQLLDEPILISEQKKIELISSFPSHEQETLHLHFRLAEGQNLLKKAKPALAHSIKETLLPFAYLQKLPHIESKKTPFIIMENIAGDWKSFFKPFEKRTTVLYFHSKRAFSHSLLFPDLVKHLCQEQHLVLIGDQYPTELYRIQSEFFYLKPSFELVTLDQRSCINGEELLHAFCESLMEWQNDQKKESASSDTFYRLSRDLMDTIELLRLGSKRIFSYKSQRLFRNRNDPYKGAKTKPGDLPLIQALEREAFNKMSLIGPIKPIVKHKKKRLAHIISMCSDANNHAPSRILRTLLFHHNQEKYELYLIVHELTLLRFAPYPSIDYTSSPSKKNAIKLLAACKQRGIKVYIEDRDDTFENIAEDICHYLSNEAIDIAIFHESPPISSLICQRSTVPLKAFLDHGTTFPLFEAYDLLIVSNLDCFPISNHPCKNIVDLPVVTDCRDTWESLPPQRSSFPVPEGAQIMTTASNYLCERISEDNIWAICEILRRCPNAYYLPMGRTKTPKLQDAFAEAGFEDRVIFLGNQASPSQLIRSMDLYLNEFPFGGSIGVLDAMASGTPIVTMYYEEGAPQGRYAGHYVGKEYCIHSEKKEDYVDFACRLLKDTSFYNSYSQHIKKQYEQRINPQKYANDLEAIIENQISKLEVSIA